MKRKQLCVLVASLLLTSASMEISLAAPVTPQTTAFSYQGQLNAGGTFPTGAYQFTFTLYDSATGGAVDRAIHAAAAEQRFVGGVDDGVDVQRRDVVSDDFRFRLH